MEDTTLLGIVLAVVASTNLNVGKGIQKWKVRVLGNGRRVLSAPHRKDFVLWVLGVLLTVTATPLYSFALKYSDKPSLVSSLNGVGMIGLVLFAWLVLRERIGRQELGGAVLVLTGVTMMGVFDQTAGEQDFSLAPFLVCAAVTVAVFAPLAVYAWRTRRFFGVVFGAIPGVLIGVAMILGKMALVESGNSVLGQLRNPYPYVALGIGTGALILTQVAFWRARAMVVVPTINSFVILTPVVFEYFTFGTTLAPLQWLAVASTIAGVVLLTATSKQDRLEEAVSGREDESRPA